MSYLRLQLFPPGPSNKGGELHDLAPGASVHARCGGRLYELRTRHGHAEGGDGLVEVCSKCSAWRSSLGTGWRDPAKIRLVRS